MDIFQAENRLWIQKAEKKANEIISQIKKKLRQSNCRKSNLEINVSALDPIWKSGNNNLQNQHREDTEDRK